MWAERSRPGLGTEATKAFAGAETNIAQEADNFGRGRAYPRLRVSTTLIADHAEHIARRILQEAIKESTVNHWLRRADELEQVGTPWADDAALECRRHAWLLAHLDDSEVAA